MKNRRLVLLMRRRIRRILGQCVGTSIITDIDAAGRQIFPTSVLPVTSRSFVYSDAGEPVLLSPQGSPSRVRLIALDEDPPMVDLGTETGVGHLTSDEPGSGDIFATRGERIVRLNLSPPGTTVIHNVGRPVLALAAAGDGAFAAILAGGNVLPFIITADGQLRQLWNTGDVPGFFPTTLAVRGDRVFVGGWRFLGSVYTGVVVSIPRTGGGPGLIRTVAELGTGTFEGSDLAASDRDYRQPAAMVFLDDDLVIASAALLSSSLPGAPERSHLLRIVLTATGVEQARSEIPVEVPDNYVNVTDMAELDGQLFLVDSRRRSTRPETLDSQGRFLSGRLLRVCPD
ncbi:hypothetical protein GCM10017691_60950 [Pseudonocardia petroleophila]|uniref:Uncharacterized protein n=1 Tax=Pseudonocardia petroleophila TaxID=37331 RepID=A0A7G7MMB1_9PSEU|nr:hypothetical protein [Pseudonocardia petroleophila]QNG53922.1 hypothetical protein H6H00_08405 [Pseudonocardia petroleophila]